MNLENSIYKLLHELENKKGITDIMINAPDQVFIEKDDRLMHLAYHVTESDAFEFIKDVSKLNQRSCDIHHPILDGLLTDGSRINIVHPPFANKFPAITIRKYIKTIKSFEENPGIFGLDSKMVELFRAIVLAKKNLIVSGGTGVGKSTFLNLMLAEVDTRERIVTIEDTIELSLRGNNVVRLEVGYHFNEGVPVTASSLVKTTLRMRPNRIIVGEVRGGEVFDLLSAMNTGHAGSMTSIHANSSTEVLNRMENLFLMTGFDLPYQVVRKEMSQAINFIVHLSRNKEGSRTLNQLVEVTGMERDVILTQKIIEQNDEGRPEFTGIVPKVIKELVSAGGLPEGFFSAM